MFAVGTYWSPLRLELLRQAHEVTTTRAKLRREHADAGAVSNEIRERCHAMTPTTLLSYWFSLSVAELFCGEKGPTPSTANPGKLPGVLGIWNLPFQAPKIVLTRVCGSSNVDM
jgi:hypothetical protein